MDEDHSKYHSSNAFCGYAGPEEMQHLQDLVGKLSELSCLPQFYLYFFFLQVKFDYKFIKKFILSK